MDSEGMIQLQGIFPFGDDIILRIIGYSQA